MTPTLRQILAAGVSLQVADDDRIRANGPLTDALRELIRANKPALVEELTSVPHYRWWVVLGGDSGFEVVFNPEFNRGQVLAKYPGAVIEPLPESMH